MILNPLTWFLAGLIIGMAIISFYILLGIRKGTIIIQRKN